MAVTSPAMTSPAMTNPTMTVSWGARSSVDLPEHDIDRAENGRHVGQHVAAAQKVHRLQMGKARRADLALVRLVGAVRDQVDAELALGRFDRGVNFARRYMITLGVKLEVMDQRFHRALHLFAFWRHYLVIVDRHRSLPIRRT